MQHGKRETTQKAGSGNGLFLSELQPKDLFDARARHGTTRAAARSHHTVDGAEAIASVLVVFVGSEGVNLFLSLAILLYLVVLGRKKETHVAYGQAGSMVCHLERFWLLNLLTTGKKNTR